MFPWTALKMFTGNLTPVREFKMEDKVGILVEETGCDSAEAELALQMAGYEVPKALQVLASRLRNILVIKIKFRDLSHPRFGLALAVANIKTGEVLRSRAVVSFNPVVYIRTLEGYWFEFEKDLYARRLWEGSLQAESLDLEGMLSQYVRQILLNKPCEMNVAFATRLETELGTAFGRVMNSPKVEVKVRGEILSLGEFNSLRIPTGEKSMRRRGSHREGQDHTVIKIGIEEDALGIPASEIKSGDMISAVIMDSRDLAHYLWKIFGGYQDGVPISVLAPVEAVEVVSSKIFLRARFSLGVCGDAAIPLEKKIKAVRVLLKHPVSSSWWKRILKK